MGNNKSSSLAVNSSFDYSCELYKLLEKERPGGNIFFSPLGIASTLALLAAGADGNTREQILEALGHSGDSKTNSTFKRLLHTFFQKPNSATALDNLFFISTAYPVEKNFTDISQKFYGSPVVSIDFEAGRETVLEKVNGFIELSTSHRVTEFGSEVDTDTRFVNANFVYHQALWNTNFHPTYTEKEKFYINASTTVNVYLMNQQGKFKYFFDQTLSCDVVALPYRDNRTTMLLLVPQLVDGLSIVEAELSSQFLRKVINSLTKKTEVKIEIPKFQLDETYSMAPVLNAMGITNLFVEGAAELQEISKVPGLYVNQILCNGILNVTEQGSDKPPKTKDTPDFGVPKIKADHPFLFVVYDDRTKMICCMGRLVDPQSII